MPTQRRTAAPRLRWTAALVSLALLSAPVTKAPVTKAADAPAAGNNADRPVRALLVIGGCCHDYNAQKDLITKGVSARANVEWTVAYDPDKTTRHRNPVYDSDDWAKGFDVVVHDECTADVKEADFIDRVLKPHRDGLPAVILHCGMHSYRGEGFPKDTQWFQFTGMGSTGHGPQQPIEVTYTDQEHPVTKGLENWTTINEELYNNTRVYDTARPLAGGKQKVRDRRTGEERVAEAVVAWTNTYNGKTRVFATTLGHNNQTVGDERYLNLVTRGLLWSVDKLNEQYLKPAKKVLSDDQPPAAGGGKAAADDLARGKQVLASSVQDESRRAAAAVDGDLATRWCASDDSLPQWFQVDLGKPQDLSGCRITWEMDGVAYRHKVEGSTDGKEWVTIADRTDSPANTQVEPIEFSGCCADMEAAKGVRYVRLTVTGANPGAWASVYEFEVFGANTTPAEAKTTAAVGQGREGQTLTINEDTKRKILAGLKAPEGFDLTVFAAPPDVNYPTVVAATPTGELFVGIDEMGSLGREPGRGKVLRLVDADGDGTADRSTLFAKMDHPRGLAWDDATHTLYVLHPPFLTAYVDANNDGVADRSDVLVKGITNEKIQAQRGADHTTNGIRLAIDGWLYIAMGDFGAVRAVGKDGAELQMHAGGVVRVRTDGTGLETYTHGQRNIYDVAIDPLMNAFTRDNTNDGDGWDVRLSQIIPTGQYGYPRLFKNFPDEIVQPLAVLGGGSPCGSLFVDEPTLSSQYGNTLYTVEWGRNAIMRHPLTAEGAGFKAAEVKWMDLPRGTDIDVDGRGRFYAASWANGSFNYSGPDVGYLIRLAPKGQEPEPFPDMKKASDEELIRHLASPSGVRRMSAQREILRRGDKPAFDQGLQRLATSNEPIQSRAAALFTLKLLRGDKSHAALADLVANGELREFALRALADRRNDETVPAEPFVTALRDANPRVRLAAAWGLGRLGKADAAPALLPLVADADPLVSHVAVNSLVALKATDVCLKALDPSTPQLVPGAARVLQALHDTRVVDGLTERLTSTQDPSVRAAIYRALCRLAYREAEWDASWWGTRPDTSGPYYKLAEWEGTPKVLQALRAALAGERPEAMRGLIVELKRHKVALPEAMPIVARLAATDPAFKQVMVDLLSSQRALSADEVALVRPIAAGAKEDVALRAKALRLLARDDSTAAREATADLLASLIAEPSPAGELTSAFIDITRDGRNARNIPYFAKLAETGDTPAKRELGYTVLLNVANARAGRGDARATALAAVDKGWKDAAGAAALLRAIGRTKPEGYEDVVEVMLADSNAQVASAAAFAAERLGLQAAAGAAASNGMTVDSVGLEKAAELALQGKGDAKLGAEVFNRQGCVNCHTVSAEEVPKGPFLGGIATRYSRPELVESILKPSAKISQGFETQWFRAADNQVYEGFVTRESGDEIELRNIAAEPTVLRKSDIKARGKRDLSVMPEGLAGNLTPQELANLVAYMESLKAQ